ncbi:hypothetical protein C0J52_19756 [Blattella germanica]|nr:hypothetical protein C0J52_19756 [Blattella germanica]
MVESKVGWTRPKSVPFPTVWKRCVGLKEMENGQIPKFRIEDVTEDMHDDILAFMNEFHFDKVYGSVMMRGLKLYEDPEAMKEFEGRWKRALNLNISVVAFLDDGSEGDQRTIAGVNILNVSQRSRPETPEMYKTAKVKAIIRSLRYACGIVNIFDKYGIEEYISALGLLVHPTFRGQGLGLEILKVRYDVGRAMGLKGTMTVFSGDASQKLAYRAGMEFLSEVSYDYFKEDDGSPTYGDVECKTMVTMGKKIE